LFPFLEEKEKILLDYPYKMPSSKSLFSVAVVGVLLTVGVVAQIPGSNFKDFLLKNMVVNGTIPRSFAIQPVTYYETIPEDQKLNEYTEPQFVATCGGNVSAGALNNYTFQTEVWLTTLGLNIYDGAVRCIALSLIGESKACLNYTVETLVDHKTAQFPDIRGDKECAGVMEYGQCTDPQQAGVCGFCYGDGATNADKSLTVNNSYFFRLIGDFWAIEGTVDERCPDLKRLWTWNDYKPILGENAWAQLIGPIHNAVLINNGDINSITDEDPMFILGIQFLTGLESMAVGNTGAYYYTPRNTWFGYSATAQNIGSTVSIENQASLLGGLKLLYDVIDGKTTTQYKSVLPKLKTMISKLTTLILSAYDRDLGFFRQGFTYDPIAGTLNWGQNGEPLFAVDCQTWVSSVLGTRLIDTTFGDATAYNLWQTVKLYANYTCPSGDLCGVGYTFNNISGQVLSGEWTYGAMNWLKIMQNDSDYNSTLVGNLNSDELAMNFGLYSYVVTSTQINNSTESYDTVLYADSRYWIPFGWFANPLPALASTGWAVMVANSFNPFHLHGYLCGAVADWTF
jgi:hypothetical protein